MTDKKNLCKFNDYITPNFHIGNTQIAIHDNRHKISLQMNKQRSLEKMNHIRSIQQIKQNHPERHLSYKPNPFLKNIDMKDHKSYLDYLQSRQYEIKKNLKRQKIAQIFNIKSINLVDKAKYEQNKLEGQKQKSKQNHIYAQFKRMMRHKDSTKTLNLIITDKIQPIRQKNRQLTQQKRNYSTFLNKICQSKQVTLSKNTQIIDQKLTEYYEYLRIQCQLHGLRLKQIQNYCKKQNAVTFHIGRGNNGHLIKEILKKRWWWTCADQKVKTSKNFVWTQLKQKNYYTRGDLETPYLQKTNRDIDTKQQNNEGKMLQDLNEVKIHNHFQFNEFIGNKKALYYNMKKYYQDNGKQVFDYLPVTFHIKKPNDPAWQQFTRYYQQDCQQHPNQQRLWIIKPGQNSNRGNGITIHSQYQKIKSLVQTELASEKKTFIVQKYIDQPFLYNKRKFDLRCYMLLARLNGKIKGFWYNEGYIRTSCFEFQLNDTQNDFIHLTNDAIQVNSQKYGKYQDGNKLSYHNFQKYVQQKGNYNFLGDICPQLKKIATDSVQACYHMLGQWNNLPTFQIFGLDFMIDANFKPWLIQINTNPCLQTSSTTLQRVIPRMVDNAFKLTLDVLFPPPQVWPHSKRHFMPNKIANNLFELIFDESSKEVQQPISQEIIAEMGEVEQDNQVYEQNVQKNVQKESK